MIYVLFLSLSSVLFPGSHFRERGHSRLVTRLCYGYGYKRISLMVPIPFNLQSTCTCHTTSCVVALQLSQPLHLVAFSLCPCACVLRHSYRPCLPNLVPWYQDATSPGDGPGGANGQSEIASESFVTPRKSNSEVREENKVKEKYEAGIAHSIPRAGGAHVTTALRESIGSRSSVQHELSPARAVGLAGR